MMSLRRGTVLSHGHFGARPRLRKAVRIRVWRIPLTRTSVLISSVAGEEAISAPRAGIERPGAQDVRDIILQRLLSWNANQAKLDREVVGRNSKETVYRLTLTLPIQQNFYRHVEIILLSC